MANFKTALEALAEGKLEIDVLQKQLDKLLEQEPKYATRMLSQLDTIYEGGRIDDSTYATLKRQINQYRRAHAEATEGGSTDTGSDATVFAQDDTSTPPDEPAGDEEAGLLAEGDSTRILPEDERPGTSDADTISSSSSDIDFDLSMPDTDTGTRSFTSATGPAGTEWQQPQPAGYQPGRELGAGDVIKERFKLIEVLGVGGMGKVYKGIDLLKEEARDKNPHVAIKLLNEDFKSHPEAFISLQRESSRQQKLAHPNIATVYDFDRIGGPGTPVFITMELMEGQDLSTYIKKTVRKQGGLPFEAAFDLVRQLAAALEYAHERGLVHSDFKPGNAFLCNDGTVKTLDFGIARAVKNPKTGEAEKTLFDPGKLGALTPAYASLEMLEGEEPDTRDDTYALGCVAYELLTGKHPFNKLPATTAKENGLVPPYIKKINKKSNRALRRAVAFHRKDRSPSVTHFIEEFEGKATWYKNPIAIAAGILLVIGLIAINPAMNYLHDQEIQEIITRINQGDPQVIDNLLDDIRTMERVDQTTIATEAQDAIQNYFANEINSRIDIASDNYDFPEAGAILAEVGEFYPGSMFQQQQRDAIEFNRRQKITELYNDYIAALQDPDSIDNTQDILNTIRSQIDPDHPLLTDPRPANAYRLLADDAFSAGDYNQALALINSALETAPNDNRLLDMQAKIEQAVRIAELNQTLGNAEPQLASLDDFSRYQDEIVELARISSEAESPILATLSGKLQTAANNELDRILDQGDRADAEALAENFGELLSSMQLGRELAQIKLAHLTGAERAQAIQEIVDTDEADIEDKLANPDIDDNQWEAELLASIRELDTFTDEDPSISADLESYRERIARLYIDRASDILEDNRFDAATALIDRGLRFAPEQADLVATSNRIDNSKAAYEKEIRVDNLKEDLRYQTQGDNIADAEQVYQDLVSELGANDPYFADEARPMMAASYARLSEQRKNAGNNEDAYRLAMAGLEYNPNNTDLLSLRDDTRVDVYVAELLDQFQTATTLDVGDVSEKVQAIETGGPDQYPDFVRNAEAALSNRINQLNQTNPAAAGELAIAASNIFPTSSTLSDLAQGVSDAFAELENDLRPGFQALNAGNLSEANRVIQRYADRHAGQPRYISLQQQVEAKMVEANELFEPVVVDFESAKGISDRSQRRSALVSVRNDLNQAREIWQDNPEFNSTLDDINLAIAGTQAMQREAEIDLEDVAAGGQQEQEWRPIASDRPCNTSLAGYGSRTRAVCYDFVNNGWRGPQLVVIPAGDEIATPFAIGRYEISVGDWAKYCVLTGNCKPETNTEKHDDPLTGVTLEQVEEYLQWLSERTGKTYRLPNKTEWTYAAKANGDQPRKDVNCRVELQGKLLKGTGISSVKSGQANGWGLKNYVGNVREIVLDGGTPKAAGGGFPDAHSECDISLEQSYGGADEATGFRVLVEDVRG